MLGHASAAMSRDVYSGLFDDDLGALADRIDAAHEGSMTGRHGAPWGRRVGAGCEHRSGSTRDKTLTWQTSVGRVGLEPTTQGL